MAIVLAFLSIFWHTMKQTYVTDTIETLNPKILTLATQKEENSKTSHTDVLCYIYSFGPKLSFLPSPARAKLKLNRALAMVLLSVGRIIKIKK